jgi:hypothetical protein
MVLVKILKRRDASSVVIAILIAMILSQPLNMITSPLAAHILAVKDGQYIGYAPPNSGGKYYLYIVLWAVLQLIVLELLAWTYILAIGTSKKK